MSEPFVERVKDLCATRRAQEIVEKAVGVIERHALRSIDASISLEEVAWLVAFLSKAIESAVPELLKRYEVEKKDGSRVISITADDTAAMTDGGG